MINDNRTYTHQPIHGTPAKTMLPRGTGLVLEGGGMRGYYSSGVFEAFMEEGLMFPYVIGVSAGAANALTYIAGQRGRAKQIIENCVADPRYVSKKNLILHGSLFDFGFIFGDVPQKHIAFDWDVFNDCDTRFLIGTLNCADGSTVWHEKDTVDEDLVPIIASCSIPGLARIVKYRGLELLDGGICDPIPVEKSIADGNEFNVIVMTRNPGYVKKPFGKEWLMRLLFRKHPAVAEAVKRRHELYNRQVELCERLEREGRAIIIRPLEPLKVNRSSVDIPTLVELHDEGYREGKAAIEKLKDIIKY